MAHKKVTSKSVASQASKALRSKKTSTATKRLAGSALAQSRGQHKKK